MAFFQDPSRQPFLRTPAVVIWLIVVLIGIHGLITTVFAQYANVIYVTYGFVPARYSPAFLAHTGRNPGSFFDQALPFVTYIFLHGSWAHVLINSVWLLPFGPVVARRFGSLLFLVFFLVCGISGAAVHLALHWGSTAPVVGASGAISGLMAAGFRMLPMGPGETGEQPLAPILSGRILVWSALWAIVNVIAAVTGLGTGGGLNVIAWEAHMGGYVAGLFLVGPFDAFARRRSQPR